MHNIFSHKNSGKRPFVLADEKGLTGGAVIYYNGGAAQKGAHAVRLLRLAVLFLFAVLRAASMPFFCMAVGVL